MSSEIVVPDIGDFESVEIIEVLVKPGDNIKKNDSIVTLESDNSSVEVPSPFDGKIAFAGPFRDLGQVLIIEHDGGYHTVLAGFQRIDVATGNWVLAGEPIGIMPQEYSTVSESAVGTKTSGGNRPQLYMELRRGGHPVNPLRWITAGSIRMNG